MSAIQQQAIINMTDLCNTGTCLWNREFGAWMYDNTLATRPAPKLSEDGVIGDDSWLWAGDLIDVSRMLEGR